MKYPILATALAPVFICSVTGIAEAGWGSLFKKDSNVCPQCMAEAPKKKKHSIGAEDPPRVGVVDVTAVRITTERAERVPAPATPAAPSPAPAPVPPVPAACTPAVNEADLVRIQRIEQDLHSLRLQIQALTQILNEK